MKKQCLYFSILIFVGCKDQTNATGSLIKSDTLSESIQLKDTAAIQQQATGEDNAAATSTEFKSFLKYNLQDTIEEDFNGDSIKDKAYLKQIGKQRYLYVSDGGTKQVTKVGSDASFKDIGDNFDWIDYWGMTRDTITYKIEVIDGELSGSKDVKLHYPSLVFRKEEVGGGVVSCSDKKYKWIHQAD